MRLIETGAGRIIVDDVAKLACLFTVQAAICENRNFIRTYNRYVDWIKASTTRPICTNHIDLLKSVLPGSSFLHSISQDFANWVTVDEVKRFSTRPRTFQKTKSRVDLVVAELSAELEAPKNNDSRARLDHSIQQIKKHIAPIVVNKRLIPDCRMIEVVDGRRSDDSEFPSVEKMLDLWGFIDAVGRVGRSGLVGIQVKYSSKHPDRLAIRYGLDGLFCEGNAFIVSDNSKLLPQFVLSATGLDGAVDSILAVERWTIDDVLIRAIRDLKMNGRDVKDLTVGSGISAGPVYIFRVDQRLALFSIPWSVLKAYDDSAVRVWSRARTRSSA